MSACSNCGRDDCEGYEGCTIAALQRELDTARNERIQARKERDEARAALLQMQNAAIDLAQRVERAEAELTKSKALVAWRERQRDELREKKEFIQKHYSFEAAANLRAENSGLRADVERLRAVLRDISYDKKSVAERQREACASEARFYAGFGWDGEKVEEKVRATPLVETED